MEYSIKSECVESILNFTVNGVSLKMIRIEGGTFTMGAHANQEEYAWDDEKPAHSVTLSSYYIAETQVTQALWQAVMGYNSSYIKGNSNNNPKEYVSYDYCQCFIGELNDLTGKKFRLPTEAEWEFAARGGNKSKDYIYAGSNNLDEVAWCDYRTHPVKTKAPNELGLYDMTGKVKEWCNDYWSDNYPSDAQTNPQGPTSGSDRVVRGGGCCADARYCRSSRRSKYPPNCGVIGLGFRLSFSENQIQEGQLFTVNGISFKMIKVEGGTFTMGAHANQEDGAFDNEKPAHSVTLSSYYIAETEITQALWQAIMGNNPSGFANKDNSNKPVGYVSYDDCIKFIRKLNTLTDQQFRLPTEAEWEFAARGGVKSKGYIYAGSNNLGDVAHYGIYWNRFTYQVKVKTKEPNELGLYDMSGNVWEWCNDYWSDNYPSDVQTNPQGPISGFDRVCRGGCCCDDARYCRSSCRCGHDPYCGNSNLGFRLALDDK